MNKTGNVSKKLGENISFYRNKKNWSIKEVSEKTGIREQYLKLIEAGQASRVKFSHLCKLCEIFDISMKEILIYPNVL